MLRAVIVAGLAVGWLIIGVGSAAAEEDEFFIDEIRAGVWLHNVRHPRQDSQHSIDLNLEVLFQELTFVEPENGFLRVLLQPRPMLGGVLNTEGDTNQLYFGLAWEYEFDFGLFINPTFGFSLHDGNLDPPTVPCGACPGGRAFTDKESALGYPILFRESVDVGWRFAGRHAISFTWSHISNAGLSTNNDGMDFIGLRYGFKLN